MKLNKLKTYNLVELKKEYKEKVEKLNLYSLDLKSGKEKDSAKVRTLRKDVARILTLISQRNDFEEAEEVIVKEVKADKVEVKKEEVKEEVKEEIKEEVKEVKADKKVAKKETIKNTK